MAMTEMPEREDTDDAESVPEAPRPRGSVWEEEVLDHVRRHVAEEGAILATYESLAERHRDDDVGYLLRLILDDEARHHRILEEMANAVRSWVEFRELTPRPPDLVFWKRRQEVLEAAETLLAAERRDAAALRRLQRQLKPIRETSLLGLLVETLELDTAKHIRILEHLRRAARGRG
jgi:rubrerythrin